VEDANHIEQYTQ